MKIVNVPLKSHSYKIVIGPNILPQLGSQLKRLKIGQDAVIITNPIVKKYYGGLISSNLKRQGFSVKFLTVPDGEQSKSVKVAHDLLGQMAHYDVLKKVFIVALGGGVIGDLAGYVASVYKRGVPYVQVPTSFLAQIDSAIGGKVAVDLPVGKNLVGAYYQPKMVYSDVRVLSTLDERQLRNGLAEVVKYGVIYDRNFFNYVQKRYKQVLSGDPQVLTEIVLRCSRIKAQVVSRDEKETRGIRTILNFGHTVGHAIEAAGGFSRYQHGEAIALGMRVACEISRRLEMITQAQVDTIQQLLTDIGLPRKIKKIQLNKILRLMQHDKKFIRGKNRFVLALQIGKVKVVEGVPLRLIQGALKQFMDT